MEKEQVGSAFDMKVYHTLKENEIRGLKVVTQTEFNRIVDALYAKPIPDYKNIPNIIRLPVIKATLAQALGVKNCNFFLKSGIGHVRPARKGGFNQALRIEEMKGLLDFMTTTDVAYIDMSDKHQNFMLAGIDANDHKRLNRIAFNRDKLGNYIVTIEKIKTEDMNDIHYKRVGAGLAPAIWRSYYSNLPVPTTLAPSPTRSSSGIRAGLAPAIWRGCCNNPSELTTLALSPTSPADKRSIPQIPKMSIDIAKNIGTVTAENFQEKLQYMCRLNKKETILVIASALTNMMTPNEAQKLDDLFKKELQQMPPSIDKTRQFTRLINGIAKGKVPLHQAQGKSKKHHHNHDDRGR